jgi:hypothetical protein
LVLWTRIKDSVLLSALIFSPVLMRRDLIRRR